MGASQLSIKSQEKITRIKVRKKINPRKGTPRKKVLRLGTAGKSPKKVVYIIPRTSVLCSSYTGLV